MAVSNFFPHRSQQNYSVTWHQKLLNEPFVRDLNDWNDFFDTSLFSRNRRPQIERRRSSATDVSDDKNMFRVKLDVSHYKPEQICVKIVDNFILISGKHEEVMDQHGWVSRQFNRRYALPEECDSEKVFSSLSSDGVLIIEAPKKVLEQLNDNERIVPITVMKQFSNEK